MASACRPTARCSMGTSKRSRTASITCSPCERVYHEAGAPTPMWLSYDEIVTLIRGAGKEPVERDSLYQTVRTFEGYETKPAAVPVRSEGPAPQGALFQIAHRSKVSARRKQPVGSVVDAAE